MGSWASKFSSWPQLLHKLLCPMPQLLRIPILVRHHNLIEKSLTEKSDIWTSTPLASRLGCNLLLPPLTKLQVCLRHRRHLRLPRGRHWRPTTSWRAGQCLPLVPMRSLLLAQVAGSGRRGLPWLDKA